LESTTKLFTTGYHKKEQLLVSIQLQYRLLHPEVSLSHIAKITGVPRSSLYYKSTKLVKDIIIKEIIIWTLKQDQFLGSKRMSDHLRIFHQITLNHKKISRVKQLFGIQVRYHRANPKTRDQGLTDTQTLGISNLVKDLIPTHSNHIWSSVLHIYSTRVSGTIWLH